MEYGRLETEPTAVVCRRLGDESRTGCLRLREDGAPPAEDIRIYLRDGRIYTATAPQGRPRLGDRLVGGGHLTTSALEHALELQRQGGGRVRLGEILVDEGLLNRTLLREMVRDQICDSLAVGLSRSTGQWRFVDGEEVDEDVPLGMAMTDTLMEGARRLGELEVIRAQLGSLDAVVDFLPGSNEVRVSLKADEWEMLTHIDGRTTVAEIADRTGYSLLETARIIYGLVSSGILRAAGGTTPLPLEGRAPVPPPPPAPETARDQAQVDDLLGELGLMHAPAEAGGAATMPPPVASPPLAPPPPPPAPRSPAPRRPAPADDQPQRGGPLGRFRRK